MGLLLFHADVILGYISAQEVDSKVAEMIYLLRKLKLELNLSEIQGKYTELAKIVTISISNWNFQLIGCFMLIGIKHYKL